jgi:hypothetical protein
VSAVTCTAFSSAALCKASPICRQFTLIKWTLPLRACTTLRMSNTTSASLTLYPGGPLEGLPLKAAPIRRTPPTFRRDPSVATRSCPGHSKAVDRNSGPPASRFFDFHHKKPTQSEGQRQYDYYTGKPLNSLKLFVVLANRIRFARTTLLNSTLSDIVMNGTGRKQVFNHTGMRGDICWGSKSRYSCLCATLRGNNILRLRNHCVLHCYWWQWPAASGLFSLTMSRVPKK